MSLFPPPAPAPLPPTTLAAFAALYRSSPSSSSPSSSTAPPSAPSPPETHLPLLTQQRTPAALSLSAAVRSLEHGRARLAREVDALEGLVEGEIRVEGQAALAGGGAAGTKKKRERVLEEGKKAREKRENAQKMVEEGYLALLSRFEEEWDAAERLMQRWEVVLPLAPPPSFPSSAAPRRLASWIDALPLTVPESARTVEEFLSLLLPPGAAGGGGGEDPYILGLGIAMLSDISVLLSPSPPSSPSCSLSSSPVADASPLLSLVSFLTSSTGPSTALDLARGLCETAVRELVGRERGGGSGSVPATPAEEEGGIGLGIKMSRDESAREKEGEKEQSSRTRRGARERELEELLVGVFEALDGVEGSSMGSGPAASSGPLAFASPPMEDLLLSFLSTGSHLLSASPSPSRSPPSPRSTSSPSSPSATWSPSSFLHTSFSSLSSALPTLATTHSTLRNVAALPSSIALNAFGLPTPPLSPPSPSPSPASPQQSPRLPSSPGSPNKPLPRIPRSAREPERRETSPLDALLARTAASLLQLLTPTTATSASSPTSPASLAESLLASLLSSSFPAPAAGGKGAPRASDEHRKVLAVGVVRWWAFRRLGGFLRAPGSFISPSCSSSLAGISLPFFATATASPSPSPALQSPKPFLAALPPSTAHQTALLLPLHKKIYAAVVEACGLGAGASAAAEGEGQEAGEEEEELRSAARAFVEGWRAPRETPSAEVEKGAAEEGAGADSAARVVPLSPQTLAALFAATKEVVLPDIVPARVRRRGRGSYKRGSSIGLGEGEKDWEGEGEGEAGEATLRERMEALLEAATRRDVVGSAGQEGQGVGDVALVWTYPSCASDGGGAGGGAKRSVSLHPPPPPSPPSPPPAAAAADDVPRSLPPAAFSALKRGVLSLVSHGQYAHLTHASDLAAALSAAAEIALSRGEYAQHALFARAQGVLARLPSREERDAATAALLSALSAPLLASPSHSHAEARATSLALSHAHLAALAAHRSTLVAHARAALARLETTVRRRAWVCAVRASGLGVQLRARLREVRGSYGAEGEAGEGGGGGRSAEERAQAREDVQRWKDEIGALGGFLGGSSTTTRLDEQLMLAELAAALATEPAALVGAGASALFAREGAVFALAAADAAGGEEGDEGGEGEGGGRGIASTILGAPAALWSSIPLPPSPFPHLSSPAASSSSTSTGVGADPPLTLDGLSSSFLAAAAGGRIVLDPALGAVGAPFAHGGAASGDGGGGGGGVFGAGDGEAYLADLASFLSSSFLADLSSPLSASSTPAPDTAPLIDLSPTSTRGTDSTLALLLSSAAPLLPLDPSSKRPRVLTPTGPAPPAYVGTLLRRFVQHPSWKEKLDALVEVEKVLVVLLEAGAGEGECPSKRTEVAHGGDKRGRRLSFTTSTSGHLAPPPSGADGAYGSLRSSLAHRRKRVSTSPSGLSLQRLFSHTSTTTTSATAEDGKTSAPVSPLRPVFDANGSPPPSLPLALGAAATGTWRRHRRGLSLPSAASGASSVGGSPPPSPAYPPSVGIAAHSGGGGVGEDGVSTDALLGALENAILHFLPSLLPSPASATSSVSTLAAASSPHYGLFTALHLLSHLSPTLSTFSASASASSSSSLEAKAFSDMAVACLAIKADVLDGDGGVVESAWAALGEGTEEGRERARRLGGIAAQEGAAGANDLLAALG